MMTIKKIKERLTKFKTLATFREREEHIRDLCDMVVLFLSLGAKNREIHFIFL